jgi:carbon-monoxide dehydrogenase medium subunit
MHQTLRPFELYEAETVENAVELLTKNDGKAKVLAGGLDLISKMRRWQTNPQALVSLQNIPDMDYIEGNGGGEVRIGALTTLRKVERSPTIRKHYDMLHDAIHQIASVQVKTMGTVVGNLCVATPASDVAPPLVALGAELEIVGSNGNKTVPLESFYRGLEQTTLEPGDIVTEIRVPPIPDGSGGAFFKLAHTAACIAKVNVAVLINLDNNICKDVRIVLGAVAPTVVRATQAEDTLRDKAPDTETIGRTAALAAKNVAPITDLRSNEDYRKEMVSVLVKRGVEKALDRAMPNYRGKK